jgi:putative ABC transport system permease protein
MMGLNNPVGELISTDDGRKYTIIGVVKDFNFRSLHTRIEPLVPHYTVVPFRMT